MPRDKSIDLTEDDFSMFPDTADAEKIVATATVPRGHAWYVPRGEPMEVALTSRTEAVVPANSTDYTVDVTPDAPVVDYLPDPRDGAVPDAFLAVWDETDPANPQLVTDTGSIKLTGTFDADADFVRSLDVTETGGNERTLAVYAVMSRGVVRLQKRTAGKGNAVQELQSDTATTHAFSNANAPDTDRQLRWNSMTDARGTIPPKFRFDVVYYDADHTVDLVAAEGGDPINPSNLRISIPMIQRQLPPDADPEEMRRTITAEMVP
jgi:hypothetical protein